MKHLIIALSLAAVASIAGARAAHHAASAPADAASGATVADANAPATSQRSKMKTCNADARTKALHGDDRRAFMKQCLSAKARPATAS